MSQEKVNRYKEEKANRKEILRRQRRNSIIARIAFTVVGIVIVAWIGFSAYYNHMENRPRDMVVVNFDSITNYLATLTAEEVELEPDLESELDFELGTDVEFELDLGLEQDFELEPNIELD